MLAELHVQDLGVIAELRLLFEPGMTAITGETGAGKTLVVGAIQLLLGGRADPATVRPGAAEARVEGRFVTGEPAGAADDHLAGETANHDLPREVVATRTVPASGRSRAYIDGHLATAAELAEAGRLLVDLHGQHAHQSLLAPRTQRHALDQFASIDTTPLKAARARLKAIDAAIADLGGDSRARAREVDLLRFQITELDAAAIEGPDEDARLEAEEDALADADAHRQAAAAAYEDLMGDGGASETVGRALKSAGDRKPFAGVETALAAVAAEIADAAAALRQASERIPDDPARLDQVRERRRSLHELCRKYGEQLSDVLAFDEEARARLAELEARDENLLALEADRADAEADIERHAQAVGHARRGAAEQLARSVEGHLHELAMPSARFEVTVGADDPGDDVTFLLGANPGEPAQELAKVASGGELARTMLAARLVLTDAPPTLIFDEVDAGVGGQAALAVGRSLAALAERHQVLVVTHLPQVAAYADHQIRVSKTERDGRTLVHAEPLVGRDRVVELSRMLSGQPSSSTAQGHAEELLATASRARSR